MPRISAEDIARLKRDTDLVALVRARGVEFKKHGAHDLAARCPLPGHKDKTPSFIVTPAKNLFNCPGCGRGGGPLDFVMMMDGVPFRAAVDALLAKGPAVRRASGVASEPAAKKENAAPGVPEERAQVLLERVVTIYAQAFAESPGRAYLEQRGIGDLGLLERHRVGYADGRLAQLLPREGAVRAELRALGVLLDEHGRERFAGCVVVPVCDDRGRIVTLYGRAIATEPGAEGKRHVYLPDRPRGLWNAAIMKASPHLVFVESVLDGLSVLVAGVGNVVSIQSSNGFGSDDAAALRAQGVQRVTLVLDGDDAGRAGTARLKEAVLRGFAVDAVTLPEGEDPNAYLMKHGAAKLAELLAPPSPPTPAASAAGGVVPVSGGFALTLGLRRYDVRGLDKTARALKATVRVERAGKLHVDTLDLYSARARRQLALDLVRILEESADTIDADLIKLLGACEAHAERPAASASDGAVIVMTDADRREGEALGRDPQLVETILGDYERCGLVGERANKLLCYLAMTSRKLPKPIAVMNLASSGAGKTALQDAALAFCPAEDLIKLTSLSGKALFYKERSSLKNKVLALEEGDGVTEAMYALRNLISAGELVTESTIKDPATGRLVTMANKVEGPTAVFLTTTNPDTDAETKSRFFVTSVDEGRAQTEAILASQRRRYTREGLAEKTAHTATLRRHHAFQRLLEPLDVVNPYAEQLTYGDARLPSRRDQPKYLGLMAAAAFLRQMQKPAKTYAGRRYVEVDREDVKLANDLATELLGHSLDELSRPAYELLVLLDKMRAEWVKKHGAKALFIFSRREAREFSGWAHHRVHRYMAELLQLEYVAAEGSRIGCLQRHQLLWSGEGKDGRRFVLGLRAPEELRDEA